MTTLIKNHFMIQTGMYFSRSFTIKNWEFFVSDIIGDGYWNYTVLPEDTSVVEMLPTIEKAFKDLDRHSSIYVIDGINRNDDITILLNHGYEKVSEESFMTYSGISSLKELPNNVTIQRIFDGNKQDFVDVFTSAYGGEKTPEQPYGELDETYIKALDRSFYNSEKFYHFVCYANKIPVSVATLCFSNGIGGIYNVGTNPDFRGKGYGTIVTNACINQWILMKGNTLLLQTETGSSVEKWYTSLGFKTQFFGTTFGKSL